MKLTVAAAVTTTCIALSQAIQPGAAPAEPATLRDLELGDLNFLHTTDTHGWHAGHLLEPSFSADWGDYISFSEHLREKLEAAGKDLLVIDTGDRIEGNGLYDASDPRGKYTFGIFTQQHIDILCSGNHELYKNSSAEDDYTKLVPTYKDNYLASNLEIIDPKTGELEPLAPRYRTFTTRNGVKIMAFGFIFDFTRNGKNTVVIPVEQAVKFPWFQTAVTTADIDLFVVVGHVALRSQEFEVIHRAIRAIKPDTPIQFFGGHYHIRDYRIFDDKAHALASGRFMETIGFQSISNLKSDDITFHRRYIDNNLYSLMHHSNTTPSTFPTPRGLNTSAMITQSRTALNLDQTFGCTPQPYWMSRTPFPSNDSIFSLLTNHIFPSIVNPNRLNKTRLMITNTGAIRFDIFAGPFTRDSTYIVSPFTSNLSYIPDVPYYLAKQILPILNGQDPQTTDALALATLKQRWKFHLTDLAPPEQQARNAARSSIASSPAEQRYRKAHPDPSTNPPHQNVLEARPSSDSDSVSLLPLHKLEQQHHPHDQPPSPPSAHRPLTPGYTTHDDLSNHGDDTLHAPIQFYGVPNCVQTLISSPKSIPTSRSTFSILTSLNDTDNENVDLVFNHFLAPYILTILNTLNTHNSSSASPSSHGNDVENLACKRDRPLALEARGKAKRYTEDDVSNYMPGETFTSLLARWVGENWAENCKDEKDTKLEL
ncbi:hypothetical protein LTR70_004744 [Exophiala xenobiotica]|uniref:Calcineurin-like phosphoesterase domain-containing protein n=1 Tax=Lithohypha guttulata TaxID=1690604 RepID=A0ABR0KCP2_9EURO|nr:hypothetical protein LTR24_004360 [Lithohypha guttulata]KAK5319958.1 hypothetical protein LTR70_004744 [Exophiala xenobiotica]